MMRRPGLKQTYHGILLVKDVTIFITLRSVNLFTYLFIALGV